MWIKLENSHNSDVTWIWANQKVWRLVEIWLDALFCYHVLCHGWWFDWLNEVHDDPKYFGCLLLFRWHWSTDSSKILQWFNRKCYWDSMVVIAFIWSIRTTLITLLFKNDKLDFKTSGISSNMFVEIELRFLKDQEFENIIIWNLSILFFFISSRFPGKFPLC